MEEYFGRGWGLEVVYVGHDVRACQGGSWEDGLTIRRVVGTIGAYGIGLGASMDGGYT